MKKISVMIVISMLLFMSVLIGCEEEEKMDLALGVPEYDATPIKVGQAAPAGEPESEPAAETEQQAPYQKEPEEMMNPEPEPEPKDPVCGDGMCNGDENCGTCVKDCACKSPRICNKNECIEPKCDTDSDCADAEACTEDKCYFPAHPNAYCGHEPIKRCRNNDECCPKDCHADNDSDCDPVCGNDVCETGETVDGCEKDCLEAVCGNRECEDGEDPNSCPEDCLV